MLFVKEGDAVATKSFPAVPHLGKLLASLQGDPEWLAVPKYDGRLRELGQFVREWCAAKGFTCG